MNELPTIKTCWTHAHFIGLLDEHETHAKEMIRQLQEKLFNADKPSWIDEEAIAEWRGYLKAILALKGEVKK